MIQFWCKREFLLTRTTNSRLHKKKLRIYIKNHKNYRNGTELTREALDPGERGGGGGCMHGSWVVQTLEQGLTCLNGTS